MTRKTFLAIIVIMSLLGLMTMYGCANTSKNSETDVQDFRKKVETAIMMQNNLTWKSCEDVSNCKIAILWLIENYKWYTDTSLVVERFKAGAEEAINFENGNMKCKIGWGLTKSESAYTLELTDGKFSVTELSLIEASKDGFQKDAMTCTNFTFIKGLEIKR